MPNYEYDKDYPFAAFITNLGKYNEGDLVGEWVKFPTTAEEMKKVFERIGIGKKDDFGQPYEEWFITDYDCYVDGLYDKLGEYESLDELNYLASKLDDMGRWDYERFQAAMEVGGHSDSVQEIINLTENLDCYDVYPDIHDHDDLGRYYIDELDAMQVPEHLKNYIDYEAYGRDVALEEGGDFTDQGYVRDTGSSFHEYYDGYRDSIPWEYRVTVTPDEQEFIDEQEEAFSVEQAGQSEKLSVLVVEPMKEPYMKEIDSGITSLQAEVGGTVQVVYPYQDMVGLVCNDEGKINGMELNRALRDDQGEIYDIVAGTFLVVGLTEDDFSSLSPELAEKYATQFKTPEVFAQVGEKIVALPVQPDEPTQTAERDHPTYSGDTYSIYQLKDGAETRDYRFASLDELQRFGLTVRPENYELVYTASLADTDDLERIYTRFNVDHPADFKGHSLSVSDIVVLHEDGKDTAHYCDRLGFSQVPEFLHPEQTKETVLPTPEALETGEMVRTPRGSFHVTAMSREQMEAAGYGLHHQSEDGKYLIMGNGTQAFAVSAESVQEKDNPLRTAEMTLEDDYGMIDGVINNGRRGEEVEKAKPSIRERLEDAKRECAEHKPPEKGRPGKDGPEHGGL